MLPRFIIKTHTEALRPGNYSILIAKCTFPDKSSYPENVEKKLAEFLVNKSVAKYTVLTATRKNRGFGFLLDNMIWSWKGHVINAVLKYIGKCSEEKNIYLELSKIEKEILNFKLKTIPKPFLKELALSLRVNSKGKVSEIIKRIIDKSPNMKTIDKFIKQKYPEKAQEWKETISDESLKKELNKVKTFAWGAVQGQLDRKIQTEYVRKIVRYKDLLSNVKAKLHDDITNYVVCSWFNHWTTVLIEDHISTHPRVIPTIKNIKGVDCLLYTSPSPRDLSTPRMPSSA